MINKQPTLSTLLRTDDNSIIANNALSIVYNMLNITHMANRFDKYMHYMNFDEFGNGSKKSVAINISQNQCLGMPRSIMNSMIELFGKQPGKHSKSSTFVRRSQSKR